jgi:hypothetical protein
MPWRAGRWFWTVPARARSTSCNHWVPGNRSLSGQRVTRAFAFQSALLLAADGAFLPNGRFVALPRVPASLLAEGFQRAVLDFLVGNGAVSEELCCRMLAWRHGGFSVHNEVSVAAEDAEGRKKLAGYMLRAPLSLQKMTYDAATGTVIYRSKMHVGLKRNFQVMPGAEWLELLCKHIPDRYEHLVRYVGWYSNRARGERAKKALPHDGAMIETGVWR